MEKKFKPALIFVAILAALGLIIEINNLMQISNLLDSGITVICDILMFIFVIYYAAIGYKKPHGNILKHLMLFFAFCLLPGIYYCYLASRTVCGILFVLAAMSICYVAGRLDKVMKNRFIMVYITGVLLAEILIDLIQLSAYLPLMGKIGLFPKFILWVTICAAYFTRFQAHKEAGLEDAPKK